MPESVRSTCTETGRVVQLLTSRRRSLPTGHLVYGRLRPDRPPKAHPAAQRREFQRGCCGGGTAKGVDDERSARHRQRCGADFTSTPSPGQTHTGRQCASISATLSGFKNGIDFDLRVLSWKRTGLTMLATEQALNDARRRILDLRSRCWRGEWLQSSKIISAQRRVAFSRHHRMGVKMTRALLNDTSRCDAGQTLV